MHKPSRPVIVLQYIVTALAIGSVIAGIWHNTAFRTFMIFVIAIVFIYGAFWLFFLGGGSIKKLPDYIRQKINNKK